MKKFGLKYISSHLSIRPFDTVPINNFVLITGRNGSGKTHLLQAILNEKVLVDGLNYSKNDIRYYDFNTLIPRDKESRVNTSSEVNQKARSAFRSVTKQRSELEHQIREMCDIDALGYSFDRILVAPIDELKTCLQDEELAKNIIDLIREKSQDALSSLALNERLDPNMETIFSNLCARYDRPFLSFALSEIMAINFHQINPFEQNATALFQKYIDEYKSFALSKFLGTDASSRISDFESRSEFAQSWGPPPWDILNAAFADADLDFAISKPSLKDTEPYQPRLKKKSSGAIVQFGSLSSGEKVLVSFVFSIFCTIELRQYAVFPKILLLDEVDAPLHPLMARQFLDSVVKTLIGRHDMVVIAATHAASTVALAPEDSLFVMDAGSAGIAKVSKEKALAALTIGVPTLSISFEDRRQVFVESGNDARVYTQLYDQLKQTLDSERTLQFIGAGIKTSKGDVHNGLPVVKSIVSRLYEAKNKSVFGLIDWDGVNQENERIIVLARGTRNGLENVLLDPLLLAAAIARDARLECGPLIGLDTSKGLRQLLVEDDHVVQELMNSVQKRVLGVSAIGDSTQVGYLYGKRYLVSRKYLGIDDHELLNRVLESFPIFRGIQNRHDGLLINYIVEKVLIDVPELTPLEILEAFGRLLD